MMRCERTDKESRVRFSNGTFEAYCDADPKMGGKGEGFRPHELLEAALGSCTAMVIGMSASVHGMPMTGVAVTVNLDLDDPAAAAFVVEIELFGDLDELQRTKLIRAAKGCPVRKTLGRRIEFREKAKDPAAASA